MLGQFRILPTHSAPKSKKRILTAEFASQEQTLFSLTKQLLILHDNRSLKEATKAKSPNLRVPQRREKRRAMMVNPAVSSAAANMR